VKYVVSDELLPFTRTHNDVVNHKVCLDEET